MPAPPEAPQQPVVAEPASGKIRVSHGSGVRCRCVGHERSRSGFLPASMKYLAPVRNPLAVGLLLTCWADFVLTPHLESLLVPLGKDVPSDAAQIAWIAVCGALALASLFRPHRNVPHRDTSLPAPNGPGWTLFWDASNSCQRG